MMGEIIGAFPRRRPVGSHAARMLEQPLGEPKASVGTGAPDALGVVGPLQRLDGRPIAGHEGTHGLPIHTCQCTSDEDGVRVDAAPWDAASRPMAQRAASVVKVADSVMVITSSS